MRDAVHAGAAGGTPFPGKMGIVATAIVAAVRRIEWEKGWAMARRTYHLTFARWWTLVESLQLSIDHGLLVRVCTMYKQRLQPVGKSQLGNDGHLVGTPPFPLLHPPWQIGSRRMEAADGGWRMG